MTTTAILSDVRLGLAGADATVDLSLRDGEIIAVTPHADGQTGAQPEAPSDDERIDGRGLLAIPGLINTHAHVDKSWWGRPWQSFGGPPGLEGRISHERARRDELGIPGVDVTGEVLRQFLRHGTTAIRTHVDVDLGVGLRGIDVVREAVEQTCPAMRCTIVAFPQDGALRRPGVVDLLRRAAENGVEYVGGLDPAGIDRDPAGQLDALFDIADATGCGIDIHLHDPGDLGAFEFELIIERTRALDLKGRVNIAHGFALADVPAARARDLWSPYGPGDMMEIARQHARMTGARYDEELLHVLAQTSTAAEWFVGGTGEGDRDSGVTGWAGGTDDPAVAVGLGVGSRADIVLLDAENPMDALVRAPARQLVLVGGEIAHDERR
ncbi:amidohydrolase family protein [Brachybacterium muris]|uniref:amidohydrolase family protein n=1 Tax=Brachybacterium muris TaxID=219301 RepID=UPI00223B249E|nr:amidohydrolase family protein [Brachybacterium muris]MCT2262258.1 amidohydrolase family protein [Brachybacterium muris]